MTRKLSCGFVGLLLIAASLAGAAETARTTLVVKGMTCGGCVAAVKLQLRKTNGVNTYEVSLEKGEAEVTYNPAQTDPMKIAESVSRTGFQATVKGEQNSGSSAGASMRPVSSAEVRNWFNASTGSVRVISLLSPSCPACRSGHRVLKALFGETTSPSLKAFLVWLPMWPGDDPQQADRQAATFEDPRLTEGWDGPRQVGDLFARRLGLDGTAWDVYLVYDRGILWEGADPPAPSFWMHQLRKEAGADQTLCLNPARLTREVITRLEGHR